MRVALLVFTDGRGDCLQKTLESFDRNMDGIIWKRFLIDDSGDQAYATWLDRSFENKYQISHHVQRLGFTNTIAEAWIELPKCDYVFHLEDDFLFLKQIDLAAVIEVLQEQPYLAQIVFKRQPWNSDEKRAGGIVELHPERYTEKSDGIHDWTEHHENFSTNPSVYPYYLTRFSWPREHDSEKVISESMNRMGYRYAYWGKRFDSPTVEHIGYERLGNGY